MINQKNLGKRIMDYGFDQKTVSVDIIQQNKIGEGGEGAAYKVQLKSNQSNLYNKFENVVCKELNYIKKEEEPHEKKHVLNFVNKIYSEFMMVSKLKHPNII